MLRDRPLANEKHPHNRPKIIAATQHTSIFTENEACRLFCPSSSPDGQKEKCLCGKIGLPKISNRNYEIGS